MVDTERVATMDFGVERDGKIDSRVLETITTESNTVRRRTLLATTGAGAAALLAGCSGQSSETENNSETGNQNTTNQKDQEEKGNPDQTPDLKGKQIHDNWITGRKNDDELIPLGNYGINLEDVKTELENSQTRNQGIAQAVKTASEQFGPDQYEDRHRQIINAVDTAMDEIEGEMWDFDILSNMNYTQTVGETIQYTEIIVPQSGNDHTDIEIINAALKQARGGGTQADHGSRTHIPGEETTPEDHIYKQTMQGVRDSENDVVLPPHDVEALIKRAKRVNEDEEGWLSSTAALMGYQLFAGGHEVDNGFEYNSDQMLVPANKEVHKLIDEIKYEQGDMSLNLAINEQYFNEGYDEVDGPVVIDIQSRDDSWNISLREDPNWDHEQGYPEKA